MIAVQLIDSIGRVLGNMRLPAGVRLADLEQLALAAGHRSLPERIAATVRDQGGANPYDAVTGQAARQAVNEHCGPRQTRFGD